MPASKTTTRVIMAVTLLAAAALVFIAPAAASAADTYVDQEAGDDTNACTSPGLGACEHIQAAVNKAGAGDTIHVADPSAPTIYAENVVLGGGKRLISDSPTPADNTIDGATSGDWAVTATGGTPAAPGRVQGFTLQGQRGAVLLNGTTNVTGNLLNEPGNIAGGYGADVQTDISGGGSVISDNVLTDPTPAEYHLGIALGTTGSVTIEDNEFDGFTTSVYSVGPGEAIVAANHFTGEHDGGAGGQGVRVGGGTFDITGNTFSDPTIVNAGDFIAGITISPPAGANTVGGTISRNDLDQIKRAISIYDTGGAIDLDSNLVYGAADYALSLGDSNADDPGVADATVTNLTVAGSGQFATDIYVDQAKLTLGSSILDDEGIDGSSGGTCEISYSRGPTTSGGADGCGSFQTTADPGFNNPSGGDYTLSPSSPLLDMGDPAAPAAGALDLAGKARAVAAVCGGTARRDLGAYEYDPGCAPPPPPPGGDTTPPETKIEKGPAKRTTKAKATFAFSSSEAGSTFTCSVDGKPAVPCSAPLKLKRLKKGRHTLSVVATDAAGNADASPATWSWKVKPKKK